MKYYRRFSVYSGKKLLMQLQFFDKYVLKIRENGKETFLETARAEAIVDTLLQSDFQNITYENWEDKKEKDFLKLLKSGEKIIL